MAPLSDQISSTPTPTDLDLQATPTHPSNLNLPPTPTMNSHTPNLHEQAREMEALEQIWSGLSLECSKDETVSYVRIPVHPRTAMAWNQVTQTPSLPMRLEPSPQPTPYQMPKTPARVRRTVHPYQAPVGRSRVPPDRQRDVQTSSSSVDSSNQLPAAIFWFLGLGEINIALQENEVGLYIIMCSRQSLPFVVSATYWARLGEIKPLYRLKTTTAQHQYPTLPVARTLRTSRGPI